MYKELFKIIDKDINGQIDAKDLAEAVKDKTIKKLTSKYKGKTMNKKIIWIIVVAIILGFAYCVDETMFLNIQAVKMYDEGHYAQAVALEEEAVKKAEDIPSFDKLTYATYLSNLAIYYNTDNAYKKAFATALKAYEIRKNILVSNHPDLATNCLSMGNSQKSIDKYKEALKYYKKALFIYQNNKTSDFDMGNVWSHIAGLHKRLGNYEEAKKAAENAVIFHKKLPKENLVNLGNTLRLYGQVLFEMENYKKALELFKEALSIDQKFLDAIHPDIGTDYNNIGAALYQLDDNDGAIKNYQNSLKIKENILGKNHSAIAVTLNNIAEIYRYQEEYEKAIEYFNHAIEIETLVYGRKNTHTAITLYNLALTYNEMGKKEKAVKLYKEVLQIQERNLPKGHPDTLNTIKKLVTLYDWMGEHEKMQQLQDKLSK